MWGLHPLTSVCICKNLITSFHDVIHHPLRNVRGFRILYLVTTETSFAFLWPCRFLRISCPLCWYIFRMIFRPCKFTWYISSHIMVSKIFMNFFILSQVYRPWLPREAFLSPSNKIKNSKSVLFFFVPTNLWSSILSMSK